MTYIDKKSLFLRIYLFLIALILLGIGGFLYFGSFSSKKPPLDHGEVLTNNIATEDDAEDAREYVIEPKLIINNEKDNICVINAQRISQDAKNTYGLEKPYLKMDLEKNKFAILSGERGDLDSLYTMLNLDNAVKILHSDGWYFLSEHANFNNKSKLIQGYPIRGYYGPHYISAKLFEAQPQTEQLKFCDEIKLIIDPAKKEKLAESFSEEQLLQLSNESSPHPPEPANKLVITTNKELMLDYKTKIANFIGGSKLSYDNMQLRGQNLKVKFADEGEEIKEITMTNNLQLSDKSIQLEADKGQYFPNTQQIYFEGEPIHISSVGLDSTEQYEAICIGKAWLIQPQHAALIEGEITIKYKNNQLQAKNLLIMGKYNPTTKKHELMYALASGNVCLTRAPEGKYEDNPEGARAHTDSSEKILGDYAFFIAKENIIEIWSNVIITKGNSTISGAWGVVDLARQQSYLYAKPETQKMHAAKYHKEIYQKLKALRQDKNLGQWGINSMGPQIQARKKIIGGIFIPK